MNIRTFLLSAGVLLFSACTVAPPVMVPARHDNNSTVILNTTQGLGWGGRKDPNYLSRSALGETPRLRTEWMPSITLRGLGDAEKKYFAFWLGPYANAVAGGSALGCYVNFWDWFALSPYMAPSRRWGGGAEWAYSLTLSTRKFEHNYPIFMTWETFGLPIDDPASGFLDSKGFFGRPRKEFSNRYSIGLSYEYEVIGGGMVLDATLSPGHTMLGARIFTSFAIPNSRSRKPKENTVKPGRKNK